MLIDSKAMADKISWLPAEQQITLWDLRNLLKSVPEAVVRCKECRWAEQSQYGLFCSMGIHDDLSVDDYCSRGERKNNE